MTSIHIASNVYVAYCTSPALQAASSRRWSNIVRSEDVNRHDPVVGRNLWSHSDIYQPIPLLRGLWHRSRREHVRLGALITPFVVGEHDIHDMVDRHSMNAYQCSEICTQYSQRAMHEPLKVRFKQFAMVM
jgi:hypothetical protein